MDLRASGRHDSRWSVSPERNASCRLAGSHPTDRSILPFALADEWPFHTEFREEMAGIAPILEAQSNEPRRLPGLAPQTQFPLSEVPPRSPGSRSGDRR